MKNSKNARKGLETFSKLKPEDFLQMTGEETQLLEEFKIQWNHKQGEKVDRRKSQWQRKANLRRPTTVKGLSYAPLTESSRWTSEDELNFQLPPRLLQKRRGNQSSRQEAQAILHARFSLGNTHLNLRNPEGETILHFSAGALKSWKKTSPVANYSLAQHCGQLALKKGIRRVSFESHGLSRHRKLFFKGLKDSGLKILRITLNPRLPHNGCRPPKKRRL